MKRVSILAGLLFAIVLFDAIYTVCVLNIGVASESNPIMQALISAMGITGFACLKVGVAAASLATIIKVSERCPQFTLKVLGLGIGLYFALYLGGSVKANFYP